MALSSASTDSLPTAAMPGPQAEGPGINTYAIRVDGPAIDEDVFDFTATSICCGSWSCVDCRRNKAIFRAPLDSFHMDSQPRFVSELLSWESLRIDGYFDIAAVNHWRKGFR